MTFVPRIILCLLLTVAVQTVKGQGTMALSGRILSSLTNDQDTIDFGYSMSGSDSAFIYRTLYFVNDGTDSLVVRDTDFFIDSISPTNSRIEFALPANFPLLVDTVFRVDLPLQATLRCQSSTFLKEAPEGVNLARLRIRMVRPRSSQSDSVVVSRTFILRFVKTIRPLWTPNSVRFDSVYVGSTAARISTITFRNADLKRSVRVDDTTSTVVKGALSHFRFLDSPLLLIARDSGKAHDVGMSYQPVVRGLDSVVYGFVHFNTSTLRNGTDTTRLVVYGVGVEQRVQLQSAHGRRALLHGDTVDIGNFTIGARDTTQIVFANQGNIPFFSTWKMSDMTTNASASIRVVDSLHVNQRHIATNSIDSMSVAFYAQDLGTAIVRCELQSDITDRVFGCPDSVKSIVFYIRAQARPRVVTSQLSSLTFDSVAVFDACPTSRSLSLRVRNTSSTTAHVRSVSIDPASAVFTVTPNQADINAQSDGLFTVVFAPTSIGAAAASLKIRTDEDDTDLLFGLSGLGVEPREMSFRLPSEMRVFPGHQISIPLIAERDLLTLAQKFHATVVYDSSILKFDHADIVGTASAAATSIVTLPKAGSVECTIEMPDAFHSRDTLVHLVFNSFLGYHDRCDVSVQQPAFGRGICERIMPTQSPTSILTLDSLCGLQYKLPKGPVARFELSTPSPNPAPFRTNFVVRMAFTTRLQLIVCNEIGEQVLCLEDRELNDGLSIHSIDTSVLPEGSYTIHMMAGIFREVQRLVVSR